MGRRCLPFTFPSNVFNFARPAYCRRNKSKSLSALRDPGLFLFCAPPLAAASWARKKRRIPDAEKVVSFFSCFLRNSPLASHLVPPESLANPHFSHFLPSHPALSRISQLSCLFTLRKNGGLPNLGQAAVCVFSYAVFVSSSFLASRKAFFRAPCRLICAAYRQSSLQYFTFDLVVINSLPQFSQVHARLRLSAASCR